MTVELVSYRELASSSAKLALTKKIFNKSKADIILFAGHTIDTIKDLRNLSKNLANLYGTVAFFELKEIGARGMTNWAFKIVDNEIFNCHSNQQFVTSHQINNNEFLAGNLLDTVKNTRLHKVRRKRICCLICGELNILANVQSQDNKVVIRTKEWKKEFEDIFMKTDIILNPLHTPMGNQGKMHKRRKYFSKNNKAYFSTANLECKKQYAKESFASFQSLQYAYYDGKALNPESEFVTSDYITRTFRIPF